MAPAQSSARPPVTTNRELPKPDSPAVRANGTVRPSDKPTMLKESAKRPVSVRKAIDGGSSSHIPDHLGADQIPLIIPFQILAALAFPLVHCAFRSEWLRRRHDRIDNLRTSGRDSRRRGVVLQLPYRSFGSCLYPRVGLVVTVVFALTRGEEDLSTGIEIGVGFGGR